MTETVNDQPSEALVTKDMDKAMQLADMVVDIFRKAIAPHTIPEEDLYKAAGEVLVNVAKFVHNKPEQPTA